MGRVLLTLFVGIILSRTLSLTSFPGSRIMRITRVHSLRERCLIQFPAFRFSPRAASRWTQRCPN
jgi:hypothetical protein